MSLLQAPSDPSSIPAGEEKSHVADFLMSQDDSTVENSHPSALSAHEDARALVRLTQCPQCSHPFRSPITLPCGYSLCRQCLPTTYRRENVSYPDTPGRRRGFLCPFLDCAEEHVMADCCVDVTLSKLMESIGQVVTTHKISHADTPTYIEEIVKQDEVVGPLNDSEKPRCWTLPGGRLAATFDLTEMGILEYKTEVTYQPLSEDGDTYRNLDEALLAQVLETTHKEVDCQVCYNIMYDPVTTACGHTLCRKCLMRTLDHSLHCPVCRRVVTTAPSLHTQASNKTLVNLLAGLCPEIVATRAEAALLEDNIGVGELDTPLFVCTLGFPGCPTFLRIFEPRYRLMIRRALEGNRQFGILMYNERGTSQGDLGRVPFLEYGTILRIENVQMLPDGQSIVETVGVSRFRVKEHGQVDGYNVGRVERIEDVPLAEEERLEAEDMALPPAAEGDIEGEINRTSTRDLLMRGLNFILIMQGRSAPWLHQRILEAYGGPPDDAALFPYWFASILPLHDNVKYQLLQTNSVRQRLKITALWIRQMESQRWYQSNACTVL